jgi:hypothetical protein
MTITCVHVEKLNIYCIHSGSRSVLIHAGLSCNVISSTFFHHVFWAIFCSHVPIVIIYLRVNKNTEIWPGQFIHHKITPFFSSTI